MTPERQARLLELVADVANKRMVLAVAARAVGEARATLSDRQRAYQNAEEIHRDAVHALGLLLDEEAGVDDEAMAGAR